MWLHALSGTQRRALLGLAHNVVVSDGLLDPNEEFMMDQFRREMELGPAIEAEYRPLDGVEAIFRTARSRRIALLNLLHLSYADDAFEVEEECLLRELAATFEVTVEEFDLLCNWVRRLKSLELEARAFL